MVNNGRFRAYSLADGKEIKAYFAFENEFVTTVTAFCKAKQADVSLQPLDVAEIVMNIKDAGTFCAIQKKLNLLNIMTTKKGS